MSTHKENKPNQQQPGKEFKMSPLPEIIKNTYKGAEKLLNKVALITGGDSGIGRAIAVHFAREGADIALAFLPDENKDAELTQKLVKDEGRKCVLYPGDLKDKKYCDELVGRAHSHFGKLNILVNNAAEQHSEQKFENISDENILDTFYTNIISFFRVTKAALRYMKDGDSIINTSSVTAYKGNDYLVDYAATKGAIVAFTRSLSKNLIKKGIRVNAVAPGPIWTPLIPSTFSDEHVKKFGANVPMGRPGQPAEVAPSYVFLASEDASYFTGQILHPNGGEIVNG